MPLSKEPVCSQLQDLRRRLEHLKESWETPKRMLGWAAFQQDWRNGWLRIEEMLRDIDRRLDRSQTRGFWDASHPAILRFPPLEEGVALMGPA